MGGALLLAVRALMAFSGFLGLLGSLRRRRPRGLTPRQAAAKARADSALDAGASVEIWLPRRRGSTHLAHVIHGERGGVVVTRDGAAARRFADDHMRMFGERATVLPATAAPSLLRGMRGPVVVDDAWGTKAVGEPAMYDPLAEGTVWLRSQREYARPMALPGGGIGLVRLRECACGNRRGPNGGVCGRCGGAIPA